MKIAEEIYEIMHKDRCVASITKTGRCRIYYSSFLPYHLFLEEEDDIDIRINNVMNFQFWCASRILTLDRQYAKAIFNSLNLKQAVTDAERAEIALSCRCLSLTDVYWVRKKGEKISFSEVNLYENHLSNLFMDVSLRGRQYTVQNKSLVRDLSTNGLFPKAWQRMEHGFRLLKDGGRDVVERELLASQICRCFDVKQVLYERDTFEGECVSVSENITSLEYSIAPMEAYQIFLLNHDRDVKKSVIKLDCHAYYMMNIIDYLIGNTDRHGGNWGVLVDNKTNRPISLHPLMDFNQAFGAYDTLDGANCQAAFAVYKTQKDAAIEAVQQIGVNQQAAIKEEFFFYFPEYYEMFCRRLALLKEKERKHR